MSRNAVEGMRALASQRWHFQDVGPDDPGDTGAGEVCGVSVLDSVQPSVTMMMGDDDDG